MKEKKAAGLVAFLRYRKLIVRNPAGKENWYEYDGETIIMTKSGFPDSGPWRAQKE